MHLRNGGAALAAAFALVAVVAICAPTILSDTLTDARLRLVGPSRIAAGDALVISKARFRLPGTDARETGCSDGPALSFPAAARPRAT